MEESNGTSRNKNKSGGDSEWVCTRLRPQPWGRLAQVCGGRAPGTLDGEFCYNRTNTLLETAVQNLTVIKPKK